MCLFLGIETTELSADDRRRIAHPGCSGVILFSRNYEDAAQLSVLIDTIRVIAPRALISVDHEGGPVQRFRRGFTELPEAAAFGRLFDRRPLLALSLAEHTGVILAHELCRFDIDFSYAPVLDLRDEVSSVIGRRAFHANPAVVAMLSRALRRGMKTLGMAAVGKHWPGHGRVSGDSHHTLPKDTRPHSAREGDRLPFIENIRDGIEAIMSAHILLPENEVPAGFSRSCLDELRAVGFRGAIISDDLDMAAAGVFAEPDIRVQAALDAGADVAIIGNNFSAMDHALSAPLRRPLERLSRRRLAGLYRRRADPVVSALRYASAKAACAAHHDELFTVA